MEIDVTMELSNYGLGSSGPASDKSAAPALATTQALDCFQSGMECLGLGEAGEARVWFEQAIAAAPDYADGHLGLGIAYAVEYSIYPAIDHLELATELEPESFHAHYKLGQLYFKLRVPRKGYEEMTRALACARTLPERGLVAQQLREERKRENNGVARPTWSKPFSPMGIALGLGLVAAACTVATVLLR